MQTTKISIFLEFLEPKNVLYDLGGVRVIFPYAAHFLWAVHFKWCLNNNLISIDLQ